MGASLTGHIGEVADEAGLIMWRASLTPNSRLSFEASEFAKDKGLFEPFHKACYRAFWENGANLGQLSVLQQIGEQLGLDAQEMKEYLAIGHYTAQAQDQYERPLDRDQWNTLLHHRSVLLLRAHNPMSISRRWPKRYRRRWSQGRANSGSPSTQHHFQIEG